MSLSRIASMSERENREGEAANASGHTPVVFIHGLWLLPSSWASWADLFQQAGYAPLTPRDRSLGPSQHPADRAAWPPRAAATARRPHAGWRIRSARPAAVAAHA